MKKIEIIRNIINLENEINELNNTLNRLNEYNPNDKLINLLSHIDKSECKLKIINLNSLCNNDDLLEEISKPIYDILFDTIYNKIFMLRKDIKDEREILNKNKEELVEKYNNLLNKIEIKE